VLLSMALALTCGASAARAHEIYSVRITLAGTGSGRVSSAAAGINCASSCVTQIMEDTKITLTATPDSGSTFTGWSGGACSGIGDCSLTVEGDVGVVATFNATGGSSGPPPAPRTGGQPATFPLTVRAIQKAGGSGTITSTPAGIDCGSTCTATFPAGSIVTLRATRNFGAFLGWGGARSTKAETCSVVMDASTHLTATFGVGEMEIVTSTFLPQGRVGVFYRAPIRVEGGAGRGPTVFRIVTGVLPTGLTLRPTRDPNVATISGRPTRSEASRFTVRTSRGAAAAKKVFEIAIVP
jgi:hypothetical protein